MSLYNGGKMTIKHDLVITALQQRIGELVANYETQIAILRADITMNMQENETSDDDSNDLYIAE
jgi:hypothetical protein